MAVLDEQKKVLGNEAVARQRELDRVTRLLVELQKSVSSEADVHRKAVEKAITSSVRLVSE